MSGIKLEVARAQGALLLNNLRAGLPGGAKLALDGAVADAASGKAFHGDLTLHGTSLLVSSIGPQRTRRWRKRCATRGRSRCRGASK